MVDSEGVTPPTFRALTPSPTEAKETYPIAPSSDATRATTAPVESRVASYWQASLTFTTSSKPSRVPEPVSRPITVIALSGPPTSFQLVTSFLKIEASCSAVRSAAALFLWTIIAMPSKAMVMASYLPSGFSLSLTARERLPIWAVPSFRAVIAAPEPVACKSMVSSGCLSPKASPRAPQTFSIEVEPAITRLPVSFAAVLVSPDPLLPVSVPGTDELAPTSPAVQPVSPASPSRAAADRAMIFFSMLASS